MYQYMSERKRNFTFEEQKFIFERTNGNCKYCHKTLVFQNRFSGKRGAWHIDHGRSVSGDGSNHMRNLWPACIDCNLGKSTESGTSYDRKFKYKSLSGKVKEGWNKYGVTELP